MSYNGIIHVKMSDNTTLVGSLTQAAELLNSQTIKHNIHEQLRIAKPLCEKLE